MRLSGRQLGDLAEILRISFSRQELAMLVRTRLDIVLADDVSTDDGWRIVAFNLVDALNREERVIELVLAIRETRPRDTALIAFCDPLIAETNGAASNPSIDQLRKVIEAFNRGFQQRNELLKYMNAYKELHDILHDLQSFMPKIEEAVAERRADPSRPLAEDVALFLDDHVHLARESVKDIEFPDKPPAWIARMEAAIAQLNGPDVEKMPRQVERLRTLPSEGLGPLNDKLFENASRLEPRQLIGSLDSILAALGPAGAPATAGLRRELEDFRTRCAELDELIRAHNLCQKIDDALHEAAGLPSVTPEDLSEWGIARKSLDELAAQRKNDRRVQRTTEAAKLFEAANQGQVFRTLIERFDDLFLETDKALLKVTNKLPRQAMALHEALEAFR